MADLVLIDDARREKSAASRQKLVAGLKALLERAEAGEIIGVCYAAVPEDRKSLWVGAVKDDGCGAHELVGASTMLADYITRASRG